MRTEHERKELLKKIDAGVKAGVARALEEHRRLGQSIAIWRDGNVVILPPEEIPVTEDFSEEREGKP